MIFVPRTRQFHRNRDIFASSRPQWPQTNLIQNSKRCVTFMRAFFSLPVGAGSDREASGGGARLMMRMMMMKLNLKECLFLVNSNCLYSC